MTCDAVRVPDALPELLLPDIAGWRAWLAAHSARSPGVWLRLAKKGTAEPTSVSYEEALEEALCHGWVDTQVRRFDELTYLQRFTPRRARSAWSQSNLARVERLIAEGRVLARGHEALEEARQTGR